MNNPAENGWISLASGLLLGIVSWFSPANIDLTLKVITGIGAAIGLLFAVRYHWYATKVKKEELKKLRREENQSQYN